MIVHTQKASSFMYQRGNVCLLFRLWLLPKEWRYPVTVLYGPSLAVLFFSLYNTESLQKKIEDWLYRMSESSVGCDKTGTKKVDQISSEFSLL
jgi:hypothetical protein